jgi:Beta-propeller repeat
MSFRSILERCLSRLGLRRPQPTGARPRHARLSLEPLEDRMCPSPATLDFSTFLGGSGFDTAYAVAVDGAGNSYVTGQTSSKNFPATSGALQTHFSGNADAFVAKFSPAGALLYATYLGGRGTTTGHGIAVDQYGDAYITGSTNSPNFPVKNAFQSQYGGQGDAFVTELNSTGTALLYSTYLGGTAEENLNAGVPYGSIAVDQNGNAYVTGVCGPLSSNFPTLNGLPATVGGVFVTRLNTNASGSASLVYSTVFNALNVSGIAVDNGGDAYITGTAGSSFTTTPGAYLTSGATGYMAKLNTNAVGSAALVYATYLSAAGLFTHAIAVDQAGDAYVAGMAQMATLPVTANAFQPTYNTSGSPDDAFVLGLNPTGAAVTYASYLGGSGQDGANAIALDSAGHIYITGSTTSRDFPTQNAFQTTPIYGVNAFVSEFDPSAATGSASLIYSSYLGGTSNATDGYGIAVDSLGNAIVVGRAGTGFPTVNAFQTTYHGAFVTKVAPPA